MTRVAAPSRLHFGLMAVPIPGEAAPEERQFGGVGLMLDSPRIVLKATPAARWAANGPHAQRALDFAQRLMNTIPADQRQSFAIEIEKGMEEHAGLGSGTALALAVAKALAIECGHVDWPTVELAARVGRGQRSAVGVHGFDLGGLIVEAGKLPGEPIAPLVGRFALPSEWRVLLLRPPVDARWYGRRELLAFDRVTRKNPSDTLRRLVTDNLLPALVSADLHSFGEALHEYNLLSGVAFADQQGGAYAGQLIADLIAYLRQRGVRGVGQSSWGPTVFAIVADEMEGRHIEMQAREFMPLTTQVTIPAATGADSTAQKDRD